MLVNKDTQLCISLARSAGNFGCTVHNSGFRYLDLNFIYKSFSIDDLEEAILAIRALGIRGAGITMPYKIDVLSYVDNISEEASLIGSANTVVNNGGVLTAYNTDSFSSYEILKMHKGHRKIFILGNGGFSKAVQFSANKIFDEVVVISRDTWKEIDGIRDSLIFNCTPVERINIHKTNDFIDCLISTESGRRLSLLQASKQFKLYTNVDFPMKYIEKNFNSLMSKNQ